MATEATQTATPATGADPEIEDFFMDPADGNPDEGVEVQEGQQTDGEEQRVDGEEVIVSDEVPAGDEDLELDLTGEQQQPADGIKDETVVILNVEGKSVETTFGQLKANAQKYESANHRFEEAAAIRKDAESKLAILPERERQLGQVLEYYIQQSQQFMQTQQPNWAQLLEENPTEYLKQRHAWEAKQTELNQARNIQTELQRRDADARAASSQRFADEQKALLIDALPEWKDPQKAAQGARELDQYLSDQGVPPEMRAQIDTAKVVLIARKAMLYDRAIAKQAAARTAGLKKNQQQAARVERPGAGRTLPTATGKEVARLQKADKAFKQNPGVNTLAAFFES
jgi:hypothetical protein